MDKIALLAGVFGTIGDLIESKFKQLLESKTAEKNCLGTGHSRSTRIVLYL
jgi:hypothetical protein